MSVRIEAFSVRNILTSPSGAVRVAAYVVTVLVLSACNRAPSEPPPSMVRPVLGESVPTTTDTPDTSVPDARSVLTPAAAVKADPAAGRSNNAMSSVQESTAMPMPGQNNDHSAPLTPAKRASGS